MQIKTLKHSRSNLATEPRVQDQIHVHIHKSHTHADKEFTHPQHLRFSESQYA